MDDPDGIPNWRRLNDRITTSGQPSEEHLKAIKKIGVETVINLGLHSHEKALPDEAAVVAALGMSYVHVPVDFNHPTRDDLARFCDAMTIGEDHPIHVHCIANARVSAFMYLYQRDVLGVSNADARSMMDTIWQPGGVWAGFIGDDARADSAHGGPIRN
jgi:uncharacterized protein (TIGR01244 family)